MSAEAEILYSIQTAWEWKDQHLIKIKELFRQIESDTDTKIIYVEEKESFEIRGANHEQLDKARDNLLKRLQLIASAAKQTFIVPYRPKREVPNFEKDEIGLPPPLPLDPTDREKIPLMTNEEDLELKDTFRFNRRVGNISQVLGWDLREAFLPCDYWKDICKECKVSGDIIDEEMKIHFTRGKGKDIEEALKRLKQLQSNYLRQPMKPRRIPLVHYPNQFTFFKLRFYELQRHPYFKNTVVTDIIDPYLLVAATKDPATKKYVLPVELSLSTDSNFGHNQYNRMQLQENNREAERAAKGKANYSSSSRSSITSEEPQHNWGSIPRPIETQWPSNAPDSSSSTEFPALSSSSSSSSRNENWKINKGTYSERMQQSQKLDEWPHLSEDERHKKDTSRKQKLKQRSGYGSTNELIDFDDPYEEKPVIKHNIMQKSPNLNTENKPPGKMVRDYNFNQMKVALNEGLEYVRVHKGEIRFYGSLGKALFTKVDKKLVSELWEFTDLKDLLVSEHGVTPSFSEIATYEEGLIESFIKVIGSKPSSKSAYYEIQAKARNAPHGDWTNVYMYVNMGFVSLDKVVLDWKPLINIDWTVLDRKSDFSMVLSTRRAIRHDVKPFNTFIKKVSVSPNTRIITYEEVRDYLEVTNINFKQVTKFKLSYPFIAEVARVEKLTIQEQSSSNKVQGKTGPNNEVHYTIEIYSEQHREAFKENVSIGSGAIAKWTVEDILGKGGVEQPYSNLVNFVKIMLLLVERCHKAAEERLNQEQEVENQ